MGNTKPIHIVFRAVNRVNRCRSCELREVTNFSMMGDELDRSFASLRSCGTGMSATNTETESGNELSRYLVVAETYHYLKNELLDADRCYLWSLAEENHHRLHADVDSFVNELMILNEYPRMETQDIELCCLQKCAENYSNLRNTVADADHAYLWGICTRNSEERLDHLVDIMLTSGDYPKISGINPDNDHREDLKNTQFLRAKAIIPDADPDYLREKFENMVTSAEIESFLAECLETREYRTIHEADLVRRKNNIRQMYSDNFNVNHFLDLIPNPESYFSNLNTSQNSQYKKDCIQYLRVKFDLSEEASSNHFAEHDNSLVASVFSLPRRTTEKAFFVTEECLLFLQEMAFVENHYLILEALAERKNLKKAYHEQAQVYGHLISCESCFSDEAPENVKTCSKGHIFCEDCVHRWAEVKINENFLAVPCLEQCDGDFHINLLQNILNPQLLHRLLHNIQESEVQSAALGGLEKCPFCSFAYIPHEADMTFRCLNIECGEQSCRVCRKPKHLPLPCEPTTEELKLRTFVEDRMTEALVRSCQNCGRRFIKEGGCNLIQCRCGSVSCYICREVISGHAHFGRCQAHSSNADLHDRPVQQAGEKAKEDAQELFPGVVLKYDPTLI